MRPALLACALAATIALAAAARADITIVNSSTVAVDVMFYYNDDDAMVIACSKVAVAQGAQVTIAQADVSALCTDVVRLRAAIPVLFGSISDVRCEFYNIRWSDNRTLGVTGSASQIQCAQ